MISWAIIVWVLGIGTGVLGALGLRKLREMFRQCVLVIKQDGTIEEKWLKNANQIKIGGKDAMPVRGAEYRHSFRDRPAYLVDEVTGNPMYVTHDPERLHEVAERQEAGLVWPDAYDVAIMYQDKREKAVAASTGDDAMKYMLWVAIGTGLILTMVFVMLYLVVRVSRAAGVV